jgi:hypothetical protein
MNHTEMQLEPNYSEDTKFFVGYQISTVVAMKGSLFLDMIASWLLYAGFCLAYSSALKVEVACSSETSVDFQQATWHYIPQDRTHHQILSLCRLDRQTADQPSKENKLSV